MKAASSVVARRAARGERAGTTVMHAGLSIVNVQRQQDWRRHMLVKSQLIVATLGALGTAIANAAGWGAQTTITGYYATETNNVFFSTANNANPDGCANSQYLVLDTSQTNFRNVYAELMSAVASGSTVALYYNGCIGGYPNIYAIAIPNTW